MMRQQVLSEKEIMLLCGWETPSMFYRYNITSEADLKEAVKRVAGGLGLGTTEMRAGRP